MKHLFIVNPVSGGKNHDYKYTVNQINAALEYTDYDYEIYVTKAPLDACEKIKAEAQNGKELSVYACGGDGTLNECVNGVAEFPNASVTHYPCGTGNDFVKTFGKEAEKFKDLNDLINGEIHPIDAIKCNGRYSINICSVGIDARIGTDVHKYSHLPLVKGKIAYIVSLVANLKKGLNTKMRIFTDDGLYNGEIALICACNGRYYGGGFNPVPDAMPDDGIIDVLIVKGVTRMQFIALVGKYAKGKYKELSEYITHVPSKSITIESDEEFVVNIDGEAIYSKKVSFEIQKRKINLRVPAGMNFFNKEKVCAEVK